MFKTATFYIILFLSISLLGVGYLYKNKIESYAKLELTKDSLTLALNAINEQYAKESAKISELQRERDLARSEFRQTKTELDQFKGRSDVVAKKPGLVELKIQKSFDIFADELLCETGASEKCKN